MFVGRLPALTGVRGFAALSVLVFHAFILFDMYGPTEPASAWRFTAHYGYLGVDLFFVLSGFLLARPFLRDPSTLRERSTWTSFVGRRLVRTAPAYYAAILFALAVAGHWSYVTDAPLALLLHVIYLPTTDPTTLSLVNIAFWSLAVEFQFYLIMPFLLSLLLRRPWLVVGAAGFLAFAWPFFMLTFTSAEAPWVAVQTPGYLFHFVLGMGGAMLEHRDWRPNVRAAMLAPAALLLLVLAPNLAAVPPAGAWQGLDQRAAFTIWRSIPAVGFAVLVFLAARATGPAKRALESAPAMHLGKISFSLYLTHFPIMVALPTLLPWTMSFGTFMFVLFAFLASWPVAIALYTFVEAPSLRWKSRLATPRSTRATAQVEPKRTLLPGWSPRPTNVADETA